MQFLTACTNILATTSVPNFFLHTCAFALYFIGYEDSERRGISLRMDENLPAAMGRASLMKYAHVIKATELL